MPIVPCPLCGYDAPGASCPHCRLRSGEESLGRALAGPLESVHAGLTAIPRGLFFLSTTRGVKRFLVPPFLLTLGAFVLLFAWAWKWTRQLLEWVPRRGEEPQIPLPEGWLHDALDWLLRTGVFLWLAELTSVVVFLLVSALVVLWAFSILYEACAGPFLDEIQGRLELRWFGTNPRDDLTRPTDLPARDCVAWSAGAGAVALVAVLAWWWIEGPWKWAVLLLGVPAPFLVAALISREYGKWLAWVIRIEGGTLWVSVKAALVAGLVLLLFLPLKLVPVIGYLLFGGVAGFTTAITLLDIPFERRQWPLRMRLRFVFTNLPAMVPFGCVASLLFVIPFVGPALMVPAASIGGQWLVCALDKNALRPQDRRLARP
jgi:uncharacterized protein involved in cysteine biosynthesis